MQNVSTEQALKNSVASAEMEGFSFSKSEIDNVQKCLERNLSCKEFLKIISQDAKRS